MLRCNMWRFPRGRAAGPCLRAAGSAEWPGHPARSRPDSRISQRIVSIHQAFGDARATRFADELTIEAADAHEPRAGSCQKGFTGREEIRTAQTALAHAQALLATELEHDGSGDAVERA